MSAAALAKWSKVPLRSPRKLAPTEVAMKTCVTWLLLACTAVAGWSETPARANGSRHVVNVSDSAARPRNIKRECEYNPEPIIYWDLAGSPGETESCYSGGPQLVGYVGPMAL